MRLLIIGLNFAPELTGVGKYTGEMAAWLSGHGHDVTVITTRPYYPDWTGSALTWKSEEWCGCKIIRCPLYVPRRLTRFSRIAHLGSFALSSVLPAIGRLGESFDVVAGIVPTLLSAPVALACARLTGAKSWLHVQDLEFDAAHKLGILPSGRIVNTASAIERQIMKRFDLVTTISSKMLDTLEGKGVSRDRLANFPNWVDTDAFFPLETAQSTREEWGLDPDSCVALYSGSMGRKQGLETVVAAAHMAARYPSSKLLFVLSGSGPAKAELQQAARGLTNVRFLPLTPQDRFNSLLNTADIHLLPQRRDANHLVMPSKLGAMLSVGKPVIAGVPDDSEIVEVIKGAGIVAAPEDPDALLRGLRQLANDPARRKEMGQAALQTAKKCYGADRILRSVEARLIRLCDTDRVHKVVPTTAA